MSAVLKPANRDRRSSNQRGASSQHSHSNGADVIQFPASARTRRERQQLFQQQPLQQQPLQQQPFQQQPFQQGSQPQIVRQPPAGTLRKTPSTGRLPQPRNGFASLPNPRAIPAWLQLLTVAQRTSSVATLVLVATVLTVYGWTVHTQLAWGRGSYQLEVLRQKELQLTIANEALKHQLASQAENPATGLVQPTPGNAIPLKPAPPRPAPMVVNTPTLETTTPLGY
ncbi:MAG: hypothetical protein SFY66_09290 [Oculatellaceae cyanobacterium bins.114]|nr:hypothetical protein [Oculatellaceae cyanobacterium bins.114]